jgi:hypothetical protein
MKKIVVPLLCVWLALPAYARALGLIVENPRMDSSGVTWYDATSSYNGPGSTMLRVLPPTNPASGMPHRFIYVLPVIVDVDLQNLFGDGLEELLALNVHNDYNAHIIAPSFQAEPWYADHASNPDRQYESFMAFDLAPWVQANLSITGQEEHWLIGFSKSGFGAVTLLFRNPTVFAAAAAWDFPADQPDTDAWGMLDNYGTDANFQANYRLTDAWIAAYKGPFQTAMRLWLSYDYGTYGGSPTFLDEVLAFAGLLQANGVQFLQTGGETRVHSWTSGWLPEAVAGLQAMRFTALPPPPPPASSELDGFNRADGGLGPNWRIDPWWGSGIAIASNAVGAAPGQGGAAYWNASVFGPDQYSQVTIAGAIGDWQGVFVRASASPSQAYVVAIKPDGAHLYSFMNSVFHELAHEATSWSTGDILRLEVRTVAANTARLTVYRNGSPLVTTDDTAYFIANGQPGLGLYASTSMALDDWQGGALQPAVGNPPQSAITSPAHGLVFRAGDVISFSGTASDPEDGLLPATAYAWTILLHHDSHVHSALGPVTGLISGTFTIPSTGHDFSGNTYYEIILTVTDSAGLQSTSSVSVYPHKVNLTFVTNPAGLAIRFDGIQTTTPYVKDTLTGFQHTVEAPNQPQGAVNYGFVSWSDGGGQSHTILAGEDAASYTANYQATTVTAFPSSTTVLTGTLSSGTAAALASDDNLYYAVNSTTTGTRTVQWYGSFPSVSKNLTSLRINYKGKNSRNCTQTIAIWSWTSNAWVQLDSRTVGTTEVAINNLTPSGTLANYVSGSTGSGDVRVRVACQTTANFTNQGDLLSIIYDAPVGPPPPDTTLPMRSNGAPTGVLPTGTTQSSLSLVTDENAVCRYATTAGVTYGSMPNTFTTTGGTAHSTTVSGLMNGGSYSYFVRCQDTSGNTNTDDFTISFSVAQSAVAGLVAAYSFNEGSGISVGDATGKGHTGTLSGATWNTQGKFGNALTFNGVNSWVTVADANDLDLTTGMTLEAWVFPTAAATATTWRNVLIKERSGGEVYNLYADTDTHVPTLYVVRAANPGTPVGLSGATQIPLNTWTHLTATYDNAMLRLYVNGTLVRSSAMSGALLTSTGALRIGGNSVWGEFFQGSIDEVRIYNRALTQTEIQADMNTPIQ